MHGKRQSGGLDNIWWAHDPMIQIRRATVEDAEILAAMNETVQQLHADARPDIYCPYSLNDDLIRWYADGMAQPDNFYFIAEEDETPVGYMYAQVIRRPANLFCHPMEMVSIDQISVNMEYQGKGYGKALLNAAYELAREQGIRRVVLGVLDFNQHALDFYKRQGFRDFIHRMEINVEIP